MQYAQQELSEQVNDSYDPGKLNLQFAGMTPSERVKWSLSNLPGEYMLSSSFGAQSAVALHLVLQEKPDIPVVLIDTGYLFPETYQFVDELTERLDINLHVYRPNLSSAWQEARFGERWQKGAEGLAAYNDENKVEPMKRSLSELGVGTWFAGLRRGQTVTRESIPFIEQLDNHWKVYPIADFSDKDIFDYLEKHDLPYHPLWEKGYISIGDHHTTLPLHEVDDKEQTRFFGLKRECGLHEIS
ncbi:MAG: phosphoadenylyl-sulfate reductase [Pseudomonadales bacterium]|nr:phosphoadenylyl-sulfate reductase [Pseudomonadales bacterium]